MEMSRLTRGAGLPKPSRETKFSGAKGDRELSIFPVQMTTTSRIGSLTRLILTLVICDDHTYIHPPAANQSLQCPIVWSLSSSPQE